jgi:IS4 transposase
LITNIFDHTQAPAEELAALYHERWEIEGVLAELKTRLCGAGHTQLRSKTPALVEQELWGLMLAHFAIRQLIVHTGLLQNIDPDRLSFTHAVRTVKRRLPQAAAIPP